MTNEEAAQILDPATSREALRPYALDCVARMAVVEEASRLGAAALRMAANAEEDHRSLTSLRVDVSRVASSAAAAERAAEDLKLSRMTATIKELLAVARLHGLIGDERI